jgi:hypothetical protein
MKPLVLIALLTIGTASLAFSGNPEDLFAKHNRINHSGMLVLGGWAIANMTQGAIGNFKYTDERKYFGQMNFMWNIVNLGIASFALYQISSTDISSLSVDQMALKYNKSQNLYLINAGLDILYMAGGLFMINASKKYQKNELMLKGYGQSVILQGGFLFAFDLAMYFIQNKHIGNFRSSISSLSIYPNGFKIDLTI